MHYGNWCSCNFCIEKWAGTRYIGHTPFPFSTFREELNRLKQIPCHSLDTDDIARDLVLRERNRKRELVRQKLKEAKDAVL